jgi:hypothetical protein
MNWVMSEGSVAPAAVPVRAGATSPAAARPSAVSAAV